MVWVYCGAGFESEVLDPNMSWIIYNSYPDPVMFGGLGCKSKSLSVLICNINNITYCTVRKTSSLYYLTVLALGTRVTGMTAIGYGPEARFGY